MNNFTLYEGNGIVEGKELPEYKNDQDFTNPSTYIASQGLKDAVNVALALGQPLLLTGEPGTGKTQLAYNIAHEFNCGNPYIFRTKSSSIAKDLFYRYDSIGHFHAAQFDKKGSTTPDNFVHFEALGQAIIDSQGKEKKRSVVLVDEIDKAPRDFPNDILNELEFLTFKVQETGDVYSTDQAFKPVVVLTSNSEKNLPDAFLRRCIFYHIPFPNTDQLQEIVKSKLQLSATYNEVTLHKALEHFQNIRNIQLKKKPATAELLSWIKVLDQLGVDFESANNKEKLDVSYSVLAKNKEDLEVIKSAL